MALFLKTLAHLFTANAFHNCAIPVFANEYGHYCNEAPMTPLANWRSINYESIYYKKVVSLYTNR